MAHANNEVTGPDRRDDSTNYKEQFNAMMKGMRSHYATGENSDFTILCGNREWKVHKFCLSTQSAFFRGAFRNEFSEAANGIMRLDNEDPHALGAMLDFLYRKDFSAPWPDGIPVLLLDVRLYVLGDKYLIPSLCQWVADLFQDHAMMNADTPEFVVAVREVYRTTAANQTNLLKEHIVSAVLHNSHDLLYAPSRAFTNALGDIAELGQALALAMATEQYFEALADDERTRKRVRTCMDYAGSDTSS